MSEFGNEAKRTPQWRPDALLGGPPETVQFSLSWKEGGQRDFVESFLHRPAAVEYAQNPPAEAPPPALEFVSAPALQAAPEELLLCAVDVSIESPSADVVPSPDLSDDLPRTHAADEPAPQPGAVLPAAVDDQMLRRERETGFEEGFAAARAQMQQEIEREKALIGELTAAIRKSAADARQFFAPMERLAIHLAELLVRGELALSGQAIRRLVENCLTEIEHHGEKMVLRLHPQDMEKFSSLHGELSASVELVSDPGLGRGSVRIEMADGVIEDLIEHRIETLAKSVLGTDAGTQFAREAESQRLSRRNGRGATSAADAGRDGALEGTFLGASHDDAGEGDRVR